MRLNRIFEQASYYINEFVILRIICIILLAIAFGRNPYSYYILLRWIIFIFLIYFITKIYNSKNEFFMVLFITILVVYNPIIPFHLSRTIWKYINAASIIIIFSSLFLIKIKRK